MTETSRLIPEQELFGVYDSSKIQEFAKCRRRFFFHHVLAWRADEPNIHLEFGSAVHYAMEHLMRDGLTPEAGVKGFKAFYKYYRSVFGPEWDEANAPKNPDNFLRGIPQYIEKWEETDAKNTPHKIETAIAVGVGNGRVVHAKSDAIVETPQGMACIEHKTGSYFNKTWASQWRKKFQATTYNHVLFCLYDEKDVYGVIINGIFLSNEPQLKKDGTPRANSRDNEFHRVPVTKTLRQMEAWLAEVNWYIDEIQTEFEKLYSQKEDDHVMKAFPANGEACTEFGRTCAFLNVCDAWENPLQHVEEIPTGFHVEHWDPRKHERATESIEVG